MLLWSSLKEYAMTSSLCKLLIGTCLNGRKQKEKYCPERVLLAHDLWLIILIRYGKATGHKINWSLVPRQLSQWRGVYIRLSLTSKSWDKHSSRWKSRDDMCKQRSRGKPLYLEESYECESWTSKISAEQWKNWCLNCKKEKILRAQF